MPRVSVVIPAYNAARCIGAALESALAQTEPNLEVVVVDDASTDATPSLVVARAERDGRLRLVRAERNGGPGRARNLGIAAARGDWIALLDADDAFAPDRLAKLLALAETHEADMAADNLRVVGGDPPRPQGPMFAADDLPARIDAAGFVRGNLRRTQRRLALGYLKPVLRRTFLDRHALRYGDGRFAEDYLLYLECLLRGAVWVATPLPMYDYTVAGDSLTAAHSAQDLRHLATAERALLPLAAGDAALQVLMRSHVRAVEQALAWFGFATALKRRDARGALASVGGDPAMVLHIAREGVRALPRAWRRVAG